jgi:hypothetical protein
MLSNVFAGVCGSGKNIVAGVTVRITSSARTQPVGGMRTVTPVRRLLSAPHSRLRHAGNAQCPQRSLHMRGRKHVERLPPVLQNS